MPFKKTLINEIARCLTIIALCVFLFGSRSANAATLQINSSSGTLSPGSITTLSVILNSEGVAINNAEAKIIFPADLLEVVSIAKSNSIFSLWVEEPSYSNIAGTINFNGGVPTPGFNGPNGTVLSIVVKAIKAGQADLIFSDAAVRANDGLGTDVLRVKTGKTLSVIQKEEPATIPVPEATTQGGAGTPGAPGISSPTHPDPNKWYSASNAKFVWPLPQDIDAVRLLVGRLPRVTPTINYIPPVASKELPNLEDGVWYFHARFRNSAGWGEVSHFRFQIDTKKPDRFDIREVTRSDLTEPKAKFTFDANDKTSGINHYEVQIDNESPQIWRDDGNHIYETNTLSPNKHTLIAKAVDKAGNVSANSAEFVVEALEPPVITEWPSELQSGEQLIVKGTTKYPNAQVVVWLQRESEDAKSQTTKSDGKGNFVFVGEEKPEDGIYKLWAEVVDARGTKSMPTEKLTIAVRRPAYLQIGSWAVSLLAVVVPLVALIFILLFLIWYGWHKFASFRKKLKNLRKEVREAESALHKAFDMLKEDIYDQVKLLEKTRTKRQLTEEEEKIIKQLRKDLDDAEKFVRKEIEDIEKEIR